MKKQKVFGFIGAIVAIVLFCSFGMANAATSLRMGPRPWYCWSHFEMMQFWFYLNITDDQKEQFDELIKATEATAKPLLDEADTLGTQMLETFLAEDIDNATANTQISQFASLSEEVVTIFLQANLKGAQILTPDQRALVLKEIERRKECYDFEWQAFYSFLKAAPR